MRSAFRICKQSMRLLILLQIAVQLLHIALRHIAEDQVLFCNVADLHALADGVLLRFKGHGDVVRAVELLADDAGAERGHPALPLCALLPRRL